MARVEMARPRDTQRSRVYAWQRKAFTTEQHYRTDERFRDIEAAAAYMAPIWRSERGRYGLAKQPAPKVESSSWGQRSAIAHDDHRITLPLWARNPIVMLHELAHRLTPDDPGHGPRWVGCFIGLLCRHHGQDANELMALCDEHGVKYHVRAIGSVPIRTLPERLAKLLPIHYMAAAIELDVTYRQVYGAALPLIRHGRARWRGKQLVPIQPTNGS